MAPPGVRGCLAPALLLAVSSVAGPTMAPPAAQAQTAALDPRYITALGNAVYFTGTRAAEGAELWRSDGSALGTTLVKDMRPGPGSSSPANLTNIGGTLYFGANGSELWRSDGTAAGTTLMRDFRIEGLPHGASYAVRPIGQLNRRVLLTVAFQVTSCCLGILLWATDGTAGGTEQLGYFDGFGFSSIPFSSPLVYKGALYFGGEHGLWKTDGTAAGTQLVKQFYSGHPYVLSGLTEVGSTLFFAANSSDSGVELWKSDGTGAGTVLVKDISPGTSPGGSSPYGLAAFDGALYFAADDGVHGFELWKSDGTVAGTVLVEDINPGSASSSPSGLIGMDGALYARADDGVHGVEVWKSDGTEAGTTLVKDLNPGAPSSSPGPGLAPEFSSLASMGGRLYFAADDGQIGVEPWQSDGTEDGTLGMGDIAAGSSSHPAGFTLAGGVVFFSADDGVHGRDLWRSDGTTTGTIRVDGPPNLTIADARVAEGHGGVTLLAFAVDLSGAYPQTVTASYSTADGTAMAGADYVATSGTLSFDPGQTRKTVLVSVLGNTLVEPDKTFDVKLSGATNATIVDDLAVGTIQNDDPAMSAGTVTQYRLYSPVTLEHLYTTDGNEYAVLGTMGWTQEGPAYTMFQDAGPYGGVYGVPLYRLYHPWIRQHHWTTDWYETTVLSAGAWEYEGIPGYLVPSAVVGTIPLYRLALANPPLHLWTTDAWEYHVLTTERGWTGEGIIGYMLP